MTSTRSKVTHFLRSYKYIGAFSCFLLLGICGPEHSYAAISCIRQWCGDGDGICQQHQLHECKDNGNTKVAYVQVVNIYKGASISFRTGGKGPEGPYTQHCGQPGLTPSYDRDSIENAWSRFKSDASVHRKLPLCLSNGAFFDPNKPAKVGPAFISFPVKYAGYVLSYGSDPSRAATAGALRGLYIFRNGADVIQGDGVDRSTSNICTNFSTSDSAIVGLNPYTVNVRKSESIGRTLVGVGGRNQSTGRYDNVYILVGTYLTQNDASSLLSTTFGVLPDKIVMLDGSGSSKLYCQKPGENDKRMFKPDDDRYIPQTIGVSLGYVVKVSNIDDRATVFVNETPVLSVSFGDSMSQRDITDWLRSGTNTVRFQLENLAGGYTYNFQLLQGPRVIFSKQCGQAGVAGCNNNDMRTGIVYNQSVSVP